MFRLIHFKKVTITSQVTVTWGLFNSTYTLTRLVKILNAKAQGRKEKTLYLSVSLAPPARAGVAASR